jgi:hypothetical protein
VLPEKHFGEGEREKRAQSGRCLKFQKSIIALTP